MSQSFGKVVPVLGPLVGFPGTVSRSYDDLIVARPLLSTTANPMQFGSGAVLIPSATGGNWQSLADYLGQSAANAQNLQALFAGIAVRNLKTDLLYASLFQTAATVVTTTATQATPGSTTIVVASATGIVLGMSVEGAGIAQGTLVTGISGTTITISLGTTAAMSSVTCSFTTSGTAVVGSYRQGEEAEVLERGSIVVILNNVGTPAAGNPVYIRTVANASLAGTFVGGFEGADDQATTAITITTTLGSTAVTTSAGTGLAIGQLITGVGIANNTFLVSGTGTSWVMSQGALATVAGGAAIFHNNVPLAGVSPYWLVFRTGQIDANNVIEVTIKERHSS